MPVAAGVVEEAHVTALVTTVGMTAHGGSPAVFDRKECFLLNLRHVVLPTELLSVLTDDVSNPDGGDSC